MEYFSEVKQGKLQKNISLNIAKDLNSFEGKRVKIIIEKLKSQRSLQQNKYWWACVTILSNELGYTKEEMHEILKFKFLKREKVIERNGEVLEYIESTAKLSKGDFSDVTSEMIRWASQSLSIILPIPNEQLSIIE